MGIKSKLFRKLPDKLYLEYKYKRYFGKKLNLNNPQTFNEKLQWLKLYDRKPIYTTMVDKYESKKYVADIIGEEYIIPTLGVWDKFDDIDFDKLPNEFVLKTTHDSGGVVICRDKSTFDINSAREKLNKSLNYNFYYMGREWPYKNVKPRIIAEELLTDSLNPSAAPTDYKFFCFSGKADCVMLCLDRETGDTKFYFFDKQWNLKRYNNRGKNAPEGFTIPKHKSMDEMFAIAEKLSDGIPFVRVDLYCINDHIYFGEMTFYPDSGFDKNLLPETDEYFGKKLLIKELETLN